METCAKAPEERAEQSLKGEECVNHHGAQYVWFHVNTLN